MCFATFGVVQLCVGNQEITWFIVYCLVFQCFIFLDDAQGVADILEKLIKDNEVSGSGPFELSWCTQFTITYFSVHGDLLSYPGILTSRTAIIIFDCLELGGLEQYNSVWFVCYMLMYNSPRLGKTNKAWSQNCRLQTVHVYRNSFRYMFGSNESATQFYAKTATKSPALLYCVLHVTLLTPQVPF